MVTKTKTKPVASYIVAPVMVPPLIPCEGRLREPYGNEAYMARRAKRYGTDDGSCARRSAVVVDGKHYCMVHGGQAALQYLMREDDQHVNDQAVHDGPNA